MRNPFREGDWVYVQAGAVRSAAVKIKEVHLNDTVTVHGLESLGLIPVAQVSFVTAADIGTKHQRGRFVDAADDNTPGPLFQVDVNSAIWIHVDGYGCKCEKDAESWPICIEFNDGKLQVAIHKDINDEEPVIIDMEQAKTVNRRE